MSEEAFHIMTQMDLEGAETQAVLQCAPLLTGIKMSNLLHSPGRAAEGGGFHV